MKIAIAADHGGYELKEVLKQHFAAYNFTDLGTNSNLSEARRRGLRQELLAAVPDNQTLVFSPKDPKYTISVFTDVDCAYCRKLHSQIAEYNRLGVRVRYLFYPRTGPDTESWHKAESV
ncbi:MAG TPA: thioredoxin fold domain-containing protein, partial [Turneriella sp.]|nr:thioredoxin fold domain-containing protein [Turneriella sp.]